MHPVFTKSSVVLSLLAVLAACGGGGGGGGGGQSTPPPPAFSLQPVADEAALSTMAATDSFLQIGYLARDIVKSDLRTVDQSQQSCTNGGIATQSLQDNDSNGVLSAGDQVSVSYQQCQLAEINDTADGTLVLAITQLAKDTGNATGTVDLTNLVISGPDNVTLVGPLDFQVTNQATQEVLSIGSTGAVKLMINGALEQTFTGMEVTRTADFSAATYSVTSGGTIADKVVNGTYSFNQVNPWLGNFLEYPHQGEVQLQSTPSDTVTLSANFVTNSDLINVKTNNATNSYHWQDFSEGALWAFGKAFSSTGVNYRSDNFAYLGVLSPDDVKNLPVEGPLRLEFSRPLAGLESTDIEFQAAVGYVKADAQVDGATLTLTPVTPLAPGILYLLSSVSVDSPQGGAMTYTIGSVTTSNYVVPIISAETYIFRVGDTPQLDASSSSLNEGTQISYSWVDKSGAGIIFDAPNAATTGFTVPAGTQVDLPIQLVVSNELGDHATAQKTIHFAGNTSTLLAFASDPGDYIGAGQSWYYTPVDGNFTTTSTTSNTSLATINFNGSTFWYLNMAAPQGSALAVGTYTGATRYPFQSPTTPGLDFSGDGRGCNQSSGSFEIFEIGYDTGGALNKLAANFIQHCENATPALYGVIRFNSNYVLNP